MIRKAHMAWPGKPYRQDGDLGQRRFNFSLLSEHADKVELCLFDVRGHRETERIVMPEQTDRVWHCYLPEARPGQLYGYRVYGP